MVRKFLSDLKNEFAGYNATKFGRDLMAGLTVTAVALPLALAFGVSGGADAAAGLITAILGGIIIGFFSGASYQISGPTGAMSAILITIVLKYQLQGVFLATLMAGIILLIAGFFRLGKLIGFIPSPVITGFTSGIALIIALGQVDNFSGNISPDGTTLEKIVSYFTQGFSVNFQTLGIGLLVVLIMVFYPKKWNSFVPSSLVAIIIAGLVSNLAGFKIAVVGDIPRTLIPEARLSFSGINFAMIKDLISPAVSIAALGMIESLLCGASASKMKNEPFDADRELVAQGIGNIIIPFFGGVPATAAIARTSVAIKSGSETRLTGIIHSLGLLASMFLLGGVMAKLPLAALSGVLMVTAWRMNEWKAIRYFFTKRFKTAIAQFLITMIATVVLDLTWAIIIGLGISIFLFVIHASNLRINLSPVENSRLPEVFKNKDIESVNGKTIVMYVSGPLFFTTAYKLAETLPKIQDCAKLIFSFRGCSTIDLPGVQALIDFTREVQKRGVKVEFCGVQDSIKSYMDRSGFTKELKDTPFFSSVDRALLYSYEESTKLEQSPVN